MQLLIHICPGTHVSPARITYSTLIKLNYTHVYVITILLSDFAVRILLFRQSFSVRVWTSARLRDSNWEIERSFECILHARIIMCAVCVCCCCCCRRGLAGRLSDLINCFLDRIWIRSRMWNLDLNQIQCGWLIEIVKHNSFQLWIQSTEMLAIAPILSFRSSILLIPRRSDWFVCYLHFDSANDLSIIAASNWSHCFSCGVLIINHNRLPKPINVLAINSDWDQ